MKILIFALSIVSLNSFAQTQLTREISRDVRQIQVRLDQSTVRCSARGYGVPELKVDVDDLDWAATFNHRTLGEGKPCMTSGRCTETSSPEILLSQGDGVETADLEIVHTESAIVDEANDTCYRILIENLKMELRGKTFTHTRQGDLGQTTAKACLALFNK